MNFSPFAWHHLRGKTPADWEVSRFSMEDRAGRLEFANREGLKATVSWEACEREPDRLTTMSTFLANNILGKQRARERNLRVTDVHTEEVGLFVMGWLDERLPLQALAYDAKGKHLIRWVFEGLTAPAKRRSVVIPVLTAFDFNDDPDTCEYDLFGIHAVLPRQYRIEDIATFPARTMMAFEGDRSKARITFRRWGLARFHLEKQSLEQFYRSAVRGNGIDWISSTPCTVSSHEGLLIRYSAPREHHSDRFMARRWKNGQAYVWLDRTENRIYAYEQMGPDGYPVLPLADTIPGAKPSVPLS